MKSILLSIIAAAVVAFPQTKSPSQSKGTPAQQAKDCALNISGTNNTGTVTCYNVDKQLAWQIGQLVTASKHDGKTLKEISNKLDVLLSELNGQGIHIEGVSESVFSINQQSGITAGQVNITGPTGVRITIKEVSANLPQEGPGGKFYRSTFRVTLSGQVPRFAVLAFAPSLFKLELNVEGVSMNVREGVAPKGFYYSARDNAFGTSILLLDTKSIEHFQIGYDCQGVVCAVEN